MTARARRPRFNPAAKYVAVKPLFLTPTKVVEPGQPLPKEFTKWRLRSLVRRGRIGPKGHPWTEMMLDAFEGKVAPKPEPVEEPKPEPVTEKPEPKPKPAPKPRGRPRKKVEK